MWRRCTQGAAWLALLAGGSLLAENGLLNFALPMLLNQRPDRLRIDYTYAWMIVPGRVNVRGLEIRNQGIGDQWLITADHATGVIALAPLFDRSFEASRVRARGLTFRYRRRVDAPADPGADPATPPPPRVVSATEPEIPGLVNPPDPNPDLQYPPVTAPWLLRIEGIEADTTEIWISDYRLTGEARVGGNLSFSGQYVDMDGSLSIARMRGDIGDAPVAKVIEGEVSLLVDGMNRANLGPEKLHAISAMAHVRADVQDLRFLDFYLAVVPWISLAGSGQLDIAVGLDRGLFRTGSAVEATFPELLVRLASNDAIGAGKVRAEVVADDDGVPLTMIDVRFDDFTITPDGSTSPLVEGSGLHIAAQSPDVRLDQPFTTMSVVIDLPESRIPDVEPYNAYLPQDIGLSLREGTGTMRGRLEASTVDGLASGDLYLGGDDVVAQLDAIAITGDVAMHARLAEARLDTGHYDLSGTTVELRRVGLIDEGNADERDGERLWSASIVVPSGVVRVGAPVYLDAHVHMTCSDSVPFVTVFADRKSLPGWMQGLMTVPDVSGEARLQLGTNTLEVGPCQIRGGNYELDLRYVRDGLQRDGELLARTGPLSVGIALRPTGPHLQLFGARRWFESGAPTPP